MGIHPDLAKFLDETLKPGHVTLETGSGLSTLVILRNKVAQCIAISPDPDEFEAIRSFCQEHNLDTGPLRAVVARSQDYWPVADPAPLDLVLIDGGLGQLHAAAEALESLEIINQPLAAIAKREEIIYVYGQENDPVVLDHHSPVLHLVQHIRDEAHRFAVTFHRKRRQMRDRSTELLDIPGVGQRTTRRLLEHFGSVQAVRQADVAALSAVVTRPQAEAILSHFRK